MSAKKLKAKEKAAQPFYVLGVEPDAAMQNTLRGYLQGTDFTPIVVGSAAEAVEFLTQESSNTVLVISEFKLPASNGVELRKKVLEKWRQIPFVISGNEFPADFVNLLGETESCPLLHKPYHRNEVLQLLTDFVAIRIEEVKLEREAVGESIEKFATMLDEMENLILALEDNPSDAQTIQHIFGIIHTIKGGSSFFKNHILSDFCHRCEDALEGVKNLTVPVGKSVITILLQSKDTIWELIGAFENGEEDNFDLDQLCTIFQNFKHDGNHKISEQRADSPQPSRNSKSAKSHKAKDWLKIPRSHIEDFLRINGEMTITKNMIDKFIKLELAMHGHRNKNMEHLAKLFEQFFKYQQDMQNKMMNLKKVAITETFLQVRRDVRNLSNELNKPVDIVIDGEKTSIDDSLIEVITSSLVHIVRNCIDHGFETSEERTAASKSPRGTLSIRAYEEDERIFIEIKDDGRGIDHEKLRKVIVDKGIYSENEAAKMDRKQLVSMIFRSGVSTSKNVTSISGRGIGLDMVYNSITQIQGRIDVESEIGKGSKFTICLPIPKSVVIFRSLVVDRNKGTYAIPQEHISQVISTSESELQQQFTVQNISGQPMLKMRVGTLPLFDLHNILEGRPEATFNFNSSSTIVIINGLHKPYGIVVDSILGIEDTVVKGLGHTGNVSSIYMGATIFGDGQVGLILNPQGVSRLLHL